MPEHVYRAPTVRRIRTVRLVDDCPLVLILDIEFTICTRCAYYGGMAGVGQFNCNFYLEAIDICLDGLPAHLKMRLGQKE